MSLVKVVVKLARWLWILLATLVIGSAVLVMLARQLFPLLDNYRTDISQMLSETTDLTIEVGRLSGTWKHIVPTFSASQVIVAAAGESRGIQIGQVKAGINPWRSLWAQKIIVQNLSFDKIIIHASEEANGNWSIAGIPLRRDDRTSKQDFDPLDILLHSAFISIDEIDFKMDFYSGTRWTTSVQDVLLENRQGFHRLLARLITERGDEAARLVLEAKGDRVTDKEFEVSGYLHLQEVGFGTEFSALARNLFPLQAEKIEGIHATVDARVWFDIDAAGKVKFSGNLKSNEIPLRWLNDDSSIKYLESDLLGWFTPNEDWGLRFQSLNFDWLDQQIGPLDVEFVQHVGERWGEFAGHVSDINIGSAQTLLLKSGLLSDKAANIVATLNPRGRIAPLDLEFSNIAGAAPFKLSGNLQSFATQPWKGAPGVTNLTGYVEATLSGGAVSIDAENMSLYYQGVYDQPIVHDRFRGQINWEVDNANSKVTVVSGNMDLGSAMGELEGHLFLDIPLGQKDKHPQMFLQIGARHTSSKYIDTLLPSMLSPGLSTWLHDGLHDVDVPELAFIYRGEFGNSEKRTIQLAIDVADGQITYQDLWPAVKDVRARVYVSDIDVDASVVNGTVADVKLTSASVKLREEKGRKHLLVTGKANSSAKQALQLLAQSPLQDNVAALEDWQVTGRVSTELKLDIPFDATTKNAVKSEPIYQVAAQISNASIANDGFDIRFNNLHSTLRYNNKHGLHADNITAEIRHQPITAKLLTVEQGLQINLVTKLDIERLNQEFSIESDSIAGSTQLRGQLILPAARLQKDPVLSFDSDLQGLVTDLPISLLDDMKQGRGLHAEVVLAEAGAHVTASLGGIWRFSGEIESGKLIRGLLAHNRPDVSLPLPREFLIAWQGETLDIAGWRKSLEIIFADYPMFKSSKTPLLLKSDVKLDYLSIADFRFDNLAVTGWIQNDRFEADFSSKQAAGHIEHGFKPDQNRVVTLQYLNLPKSLFNDDPKTVQNTASKQVAPPALDLGDAFDPRLIPNMKFSVEQINYHDKLIGSASFITESSDAGLRIANIDAKLLGLTIGGSGSATELIWGFDGERHSSEYRGVIRTDDIGAVQANMGWPRALEAKSARLRSRLTWQGMPWQYNVKNIKGQTAIQLKKGHFNQSSSKSASAVMRVIGLFNTEEWLRRLRLDFSDVFSKGIPFTKISGGFDLDNGLISFPEPIVTEMTSGKVQLSGDINMITEQFDNHLVVTLPVGTNLPVVAAMIVSLPAAVGVYLFNKIFEKQVNKLSSISYRVTGDWDEPKVEVVKIFSDKMAQDKANKHNNKKSQ